MTRSPRPACTLQEPQVAHRPPSPPLARMALTLLSLRPPSSSLHPPCTHIQITTPTSGPPPPTVQGFHQISSERVGLYLNGMTTTSLYHPPFQPHLLRQQEHTRPDAPLPALIPPSSHASSAPAALPQNCQLIPSSHALVRPSSPSKPRCRTPGCTAHLLNR